MQLGGTIKEKEKTGRPISWTPAERLKNANSISDIGVLIKYTL